MILITRRLQEVYTNLWGLYKPMSILGKNYIAILFDEFNCKSLIFILRSKNKFFDIFKILTTKSRSK